MATLDRLVLLSTVLFAIAGLLVLISISRPRWILSVDQDETSVGLIEICIAASFSAKTSEKRCFIPPQIRLPWIISFGLAVVAVGLLILTVLLLILSQYSQARIAEYGRMTGFIAMIFLCLSTVLFPMGFDTEIIGGSAFQLPEDFRIGSSYIAFVGATWLTVLSTLVGEKIIMSIGSRQSRSLLPAPMLDRSTYSIFSVIKQAIGKDLTRFSIPVIWNEPLSFLQRLAECLEYSSLLDRAASASSLIERIHLINAFIVSSLSTHLERMSKPFNPLLGETYELKNDDVDAPFHYISEQVCHHPPVSALHATGQQWILTANIEPKVKFHGTNIVAVSEGYWKLCFLKPSTMKRSTSQSSFHSCNENDNFLDDLSVEYTWRIPDVIVHNILFGRIWCEFQGQIILQETNSNRKAVLNIKPHSWFASASTKLAEMFKYFGHIYEGNDKIAAFHGNYGHCYYAIDDFNDLENTTSSSCSIGGNNCIHLNSNNSINPSCDLLLTRSSRLIWFRSLLNKPNLDLLTRSQYYYFTPFTMLLNEQITSIKLPPTDCRYRQDIQYLEQGDLERASNEKHRLEEKQREAAKNRQTEYEPLWFKKNENNQYIYTGKYEQRDFDHCPNIFSQ